MAEAHARVVEAIATGHRWPAEAGHEALADRSGSCSLDEFIAAQGSRLHVFIPPGWDRRVACAVHRPVVPIRVDGHRK